MKKGFVEAVAEQLQWIGLILISLMMLYVIINWTTGGAHVQRGIEQGTLMYTIANSVNALSSSDEGQVTSTLSSLYDINIACDGSCVVSTASYDSAGKLGKESNEVLILGNVKPVTIKKVNKITLTKERGSPVVLTGEQTEDMFLVQLDIPDYGEMCYTTHEEVSEILNDPYIIQGEDPSLIAALIQAESSWQLNAHRYEPRYQIRYLEGKPTWMNNKAWLGEGSPTIDQWFDQNPKRSSEKEGLTESQLNLVAQTRMSASYGLMQVMYPTAIQACQGSQINEGETIDIKEPEDLYDPRINIYCGVKYLKAKRSDYSDLRDAVSAYNAGESKWTYDLANRQYSARVIGYYNAFRKCTA